VTMDISVVGGGMIVHDQILPSLYHLQRLGHLGAITIVATGTRRLRELVNPRFERAFPRQSFTSFPSLETPESERHPDLWRQVVGEMSPGSLVLVATPDEYHNEMVRFALEHDQHVLCVKPLVHCHQQAMEIAEMARQRGLFVGVEYHKRFDRRSLEARDLYRQGRFGQFVCGDARLVEPYYYRYSNFQNWFTTDKTDPFTYIGCHYVDLVYFITGLRPVEVAVRGVEIPFPNGNPAYMWANGRVIFENGAVFSVNTGLGYPDRGAGTNDQGMTLYCEGADCGSIIKHDDQFRGVSYGYVDDTAGAHFRFINPDYFRLVPWVNEGLKPVGYGYESIEGNVLAADQVRAEGAGSSGQAAVKKRQAVLEKIDQHGIIATPANSSINEQVVEAARASIGKGGQPVKIEAA